MCSVAVRLKLVELGKCDQQLNHYPIFVCVHEICAQLGTKGTCMSNKTIMGLGLVS